MFGTNNTPTVKAVHALARIGITIKTKMSCLSCNLRYLRMYLNRNSIIGNHITTNAKMTGIFSITGNPLAKLWLVLDNRNPFGCSVLFGYQPKVSSKKFLLELSILPKSIQNPIVVPPVFNGILQNIN